MTKLMCLGIESTAHTFAIGIVNEEGKIISDERSVYKPKPGWGLIPRDMAEHHMSDATVSYTHLTLPTKA